MSYTTQQKVDCLILPQDSKEVNMAKVTLKVKVRDPKSLTEKENAEQDRRWCLVQKLLKKNK